MSVPVARVRFLDLGFTVSSEDTMAGFKHHGGGVLPATVLRSPPRVEGGSFLYQFDGLRFRLSPSGQVIFEEDFTDRDKEVYLGNTLIASGRKLEGKSANVSVDLHAPRISPQPTPIASPKAAPLQRLRAQKPVGRIHVCFVSSVTQIGGQEMVLKRLIRGLDKTRYRVTALITHAKGDLHQDYVDSCDQLIYAPPQAKKNLGMWVLEQVKLLKPDYLHFFNLWMIYDSIWPIVRETKVKVIVSLFADFWGHRNVVEWAGYIKTINSVQPHLVAFTGDAYVNRGVWPKMQIIRNGIPVETFSPGVKDPKLFAWVGRMLDEKRPDRFVELARRLRDYRFVMVGDSDTPKAHQIRENQPPNLELKLGLGEKEVSDILAKATYFVFTSMTEGMPLTILEAMSSGCVVIAEQVGDISSVIVDKETGYLVPKGQVDTAIWIENCLATFDPKSGERARQAILRDFEEGDMVKQYENLYGAVGDHRDQTRVAFLWGVMPPYGIQFWDSKADSHQNAISKLSQGNLVQVFVPTGQDTPNRKLIKNSRFCFYKNDLIDQLREFAPDMIFLNMFWDPRWPQVIREFPHTWKALVHFGESNIVVPWANQIDLFIAQQEFMAKRIYEANKRPVVTIPFGVEDWLFKPLPREKVYEGIMVADFRRDIKRQQLLIEAWANVPGKLVLVGPYERSLPPGHHEVCKGLARRLGLEDRVIFVDGYPHDDLPELINQAKVGFLTSSHEGGSRSLLELMACVPSDTEIIMQKGLKFIKDIKQGDLILTHKSRFRPVSKVYKRFYIGKLLRVTTDSSVLYMTPEHEILIENEWKKSSEIFECYKNGMGLHCWSFGWGRLYLSENKETEQIPQNSRIRNNLRTLYRNWSRFIKKNHVRLVTRKIRWFISPEEKYTPYNMVCKREEINSSYLKKYNSLSESKENAGRNLIRSMQKRIPCSRNSSNEIKSQKTLGTVVLDNRSIGENLSTKFNQSPRAFEDNTGKIKRNTIRHIEEIRYEGFVYNLGVTGDNSYLANGIVVHNCGLPVIVTSDCEGNANRVRNGVDGIVADPTPQALARATNSLLQGDWKGMGAAASDIVRKKYPFNQMYDEYAKIISNYRPEVSIITTSFNRGSFLERCVQSVLAQGKTMNVKVNHLIVDGGSTDGTLNMLKKYKGQVHAYVGRDSGQTDAILRGFKLIEEQFPQTRYVGWINADDYYEDTWLKNSLSTLSAETPETAMIYGDANQVDEKGAFKQSLKYVSDPYVTLKHLCTRGNIIIQPTVMIRMDALKKIRALTGMAWNPDFHYVQDLELWVRFLRNGFKIRKLNIVTANLRSHPNQMSLTHMEDQIVERDKVLRSVSEELKLPNPIWVRS